MTSPDLVVAGSYGRAGSAMRVRVLDWLGFLGLTAEVHDYLGTADVRPGTLLRHPGGVLSAELRLRRLQRRPAPDRLLISRSVGPFSAGRLEGELLRRAARGVYDFDDALYADDRGGIHRFLGEAAGWARSVAAADLVLAGNEILAEAAARINPAVEVIPSCVQPDAYPQKRSYTVPSTPVLVWLGSPSTERHLASLTTALLEVHRQTGARVLLISAGTRSLGTLEPIVDRVSWDGARTDALLADADLGLMPLEDSPFARGKCAYKLLQYGAAALPVVGSPVGVNEQVLQRLHGLAAVDADSWIEAILSSLREPEAVRRGRGVAARLAVEQHYSFAAWSGAFRRALDLSADPTLPAPSAGAPAAPGAPAEPWR